MFPPQKRTMSSLIAMRYVSLALIIISFIMGKANGTISLVGRNPAFSFHNNEAFFGPRIIEVYGKLGAVIPPDACTHLHNLVLNSSTSYFALVRRGGCSFQDKIRRAQAAGFDLVVVYNNYYSERLLTMDGEAEGITIPAIFISRESGETLGQLAGYKGIDIKITSNADSVDYPPWIEVAKENFIHWGVFINLLLVVLLILQKFELVTLPPPFGPSTPELPTYVRPHARMCRILVKAMPLVVYNPAADPNRTDTSCVICLEDFIKGDKLRLLPCYHRFHKQCVDTWLVKRRAFCPICKHDARKERLPPPTFVSNPLLFRPLPPVMVSP